MSKNNNIPDDELSYRDASRVIPLLKIVDELVKGQIKDIYWEDWFGDDSVTTIKLTKRWSVDE